MVESTAGKEAADRVREWIADPGGTWKLTDVPTLVTRDHQRISVERDDPEGNWKSSLKKQAFLNFIGFTDGKPSTEDSFYPLLPDLIRAAVDYKRLHKRL
jgi:hypothetical protein